MKHLKILPIIILCLLFLCACPASQQPLGPDGKPILTEQDYYDEALGWWYDTEQNFKRIYNSSTLEEQKEMLPFLKILYESKQVLDMWKLKIAGNQPTHNQVQQWKDYKNDLIMMLANNYKEK